MALALLPFDYLMIVLEKCSGWSSFFLTFISANEAGNKTHAGDDLRVKDTAMNAAAGKAGVLSPGDGEVKVLR